MNLKNAQGKNWLDSGAALWIVPHNTHHRRESPKSPKCTSNSMSNQRIYIWYVHIDLQRNVFRHSAECALKEPLTMRVSQGSVQSPWLWWINTIRPDLFMYEYNTHSRREHTHTHTNNIHIRKKKISSSEPSPEAQQFLSRSTKIHCTHTIIVLCAEQQPVEYRKPSAILLRMFGPHRIGHPQAWNASKQASAVRVCVQRVRMACWMMRLTHLAHATKNVNSEYPSAVGHRIDCCCDWYTMV